MENNYLIECEDKVLLNNKINEIIRNNKFSDTPINSYDLEEQELKSPLEDLDTYGLFSNKKIIIINNIDNLNIDMYKEDYKHLLKYLENYNKDNLLIMTSKKLNNTKKLTKELKNKANYQTITINEIDYTKKLLKDYKLSPGVVRKIVEYCNNDITKISNECEKLKNYKISSKEITLNDIELLLIKKQSDITNLTFELIKLIATKDKKNALKVYKELEENEIEPISLIGLIASQIRIMYQVKILSKKYLSDNEITEILKEKSSYRIKKTKELINYYTEDELLKLMRKLADIDLKIKTTDLNAKFSLELFIINL